MSKETPWTPGPWMVNGPDRQFPDQINIVSGDGNYFIATAIDGLKESEQAANARLIAAAPAMAERLDEAASLLELSQHNSDVMCARNIRALLARIRGEA